MPGPLPKELREALILSVATGRSIRDWAKDSGVGARTAYRWAAMPGFRRRVSEIRRRMREQAIGLFAEGVSGAAVVMRNLMVNGESQAIKLAAAKAVIDADCRLQGLAELREEVEELRQLVGAKQEAKSKAKGLPAAMSPAKDGDHAQH